MLTRFLRSVRTFVFRRRTPAYLAGFLLLAASPLGAQTFEPTLTVGAGIQTGYDHTQPDGGNSTDQFALNHLRLYFSGDITSYLSAMVNTEYNSGTNNIGVLDAVGEFHTSPMFNVWFGRFLPPSDRANLYGPFYAHEWAVYTDGIQDGYPSIFQGRDNGVVYWGDFFKKVKISGGVFDGGTATGNSKIIGAARVQIDFWDPEGGYYLNGTYYGDKNLLAIGGATQLQSGKTASTADFLLEKKLPGGGVVSIESEYANYNRLGGYNGSYAKSQGAYGTLSYLFPKVIPIGNLKGKFELLGKYAKADFTHGSGPSYNQTTTEI